METILNKYKERLVNLSSRNRSLVLKKIYKRRSFDLSRLCEIDEDINDSILSFMFGRKKDKLLILDDPYEMNIHEIRELDEKIKSKRQEALNKLNADDESTKAKKMELIDKKLQEIRENEKDKIDRKIKKLIDYSASLTYLSREINSMEKETGLYELFIGYPFAEGIFRDHTFVKAPLMLFPVRMVCNNNKWYLENIIEQEILLNKVFILGYSKYNETKIKEIETEFATIEAFGNDTISGLLKYLTQSGIKVQDTGNRKIDKFIDHTNQNLPDYNLGQIELKNYLVLGQFPISNSIYNDYAALENMDLEETLIRKLLINDMVSEKEDKEEDDGKLSFSEGDVYLLSSLDYSQENAVKKVNETNQLVIYGPPGTGKSQTIANIISDALAKGKKVLMVSQKRAALDVIFNRLADIQSKIVLIHDANKNKKDFYKKVTEIVEGLYIDYSQNNKSQIEQKARDIDEKIRRLEEIAKVLHKPREFGLTLQQMYSKSKAIESRTDKRYEHFKTFKKEESCFIKYKYEEVNDAVLRVNREDIQSDFRKYKDMVSKNPLLTRLKTDFDFLQAEEVIENIEDIYNCCCNINCETNNIIVKPMMQLYKDKSCITNNDELNKLAVRINNQQNSELLKPINDGKWWSIKYWLEYEKNKLKEEENKKEYERKKHEIEEYLGYLNGKIKEALDKLCLLKNIIKDQSYNEILYKLFNRLDLKDDLENIVKALNDYEDYRQLGFKVDLLNEIEKKILEYGCKHTDSKDDYKELVESILEYLVLSQIYEIEKSYEAQAALSEFSRYNELTRDINRLMNEKNNITPAVIIDIWNNRLNRYIGTSGYREFNRQAGKKRMLWPIRRYMHEFNDMVLDVFPCWLLSPETVSDILPLVKGIFDIVIFDEASQMFIENSIPTIYRGKQVVVAGDDKQLRPNSAFKVKFEEADEEELAVESSAALEEESLLDLAKVNYHAVHLNYHYRSRYDELINFSNYAFYGGRLQVSPNIVDTSALPPPIQRIKVRGQWADRKNIVEAEAVVELVAKIFKARKHNDTIGIITFNITQKDLIEDLLERRANNDPEFKSFYVNEIDRKDGNEDVSLFVKNIENVQGDERDIIIFSIGYAPDEKGRVSVNFGALSQDGGENRLNVAISRAKQRVVVVTSIEPEELNVDSTKNPGPKLFKKYLQYAREVSNGNHEGAKAILNSLVDSNIERNRTLKYDSDFEMQVHDVLEAKGYSVDTQVGVSEYKIDLAIYDKERSRYILGIECDGATYHSSKFARERDIHRQRYLESRGWKIIRIWSRDWWKNPEAEIKKIENAISMYMSGKRKATRGETVKHDEIFDNHKEGITHMSYPDKKDEKINVRRNEGNDIRKTMPERTSGITIGYGDIVKLKDLSSGEIFEVKLESNPANRNLMKDIEMRLLGLQLSQKFGFSGFRYEVINIQKNSFIN